MQTLNEYLLARGIALETLEGNCANIPHQMDSLAEIASDARIRTAMEIGFNAGHSADLFLQSNPGLTLVSFDLGVHEYTKHAKDYIDSKYPGRHTLILGDSQQTVPEFIKANSNKKFDMIFIDGGHDLEIARNDIQNCRHLARDSTVVVIDDIMLLPSLAMQWTEGPTQAFLEAVKAEQMKQLDFEYFGHGRGHVVAHYVVPAA